MPGNVNLYWSDSFPPLMAKVQLAEICLTPIAAACCTAANRFAKLASWASTTTMWQLGHSADTASRSSDSSSSQTEFPPGKGEGWPCWLTFVKHPFAVVHGGSAYLARY